MHMIEEKSYPRMTRLNWIFAERLLRFMMDDIGMCIYWFLCNFVVYNVQSRQAFFNIFKLSHVFCLLMILHREFNNRKLKKHS